MQRRLGLALVSIFLGFRRECPVAEEIPGGEVRRDPGGDADRDDQDDGRVSQARGEGDRRQVGGLYQATGYSGKMNALIAGQINLTWLSGFSYCQTFADSKGGVEPLSAAAAIDGSMGYNAVVVVRADGPYKTMRPQGQGGGAHRPALRLGLSNPDRGVPRHGASRSTCITRAAFRRACAERARRAEGHL